MISTADVLEIMAVVAACHQRTAPRMDDREVATATASVWAELVNEFDFTKPELIAAVKARAKTCPDAPEVADVIRVARSSRSELMARGVLPTKPSQHGDEHYPGDALAAPEPAEFPTDWDTHQRVSAYWYALRLRALPRTTAGWEAIADQIDAAKAKREGGVR